LETPHLPTEILVVDDDPEIRHLLRVSLERENYAVSEANDASSARSRLERGGIDLITLDLALGADDGLSFAREIRAHSDVPIIMVTGKGDAIDRVVGLELGADDYICKPFNLREVVARVRAVLRRHEPARRTATKSSPHERFGFNGWNLDITSRELTTEAGVNFELTTGEFNLLELFVRRSQRVLTRDEIMDLLKGHDWSPIDRSIDALIVRLRKKIEPEAAKPTHIKTVRGVGYVFASDVRRQ
jgi:two-component system, OmpR family, response regulator